MRYPSTLPTLGLALGIVVFHSCGGEPTGPETPPPPVLGSLATATGDGQSGAAGAALGAPLVVTARDTKGAPMVGQAVTWAVTGGGGSVSQASTNTGADGTASVTWTLGGTLGEQTVTAAAGTFSATFKATASPGPVTQVVVTPGTRTLTALGDTVRVSAAVRDQFGNATTGAVAWSSSDTSVVKVDSTGLARAVKNGTADVTATAGTVSGKATVTVAQTVKTVAITPEAASVVVGDSAKLSADAKDANGHAVAGAGFTWASTAATVASVDSTGLVKGLAEGPALVTATSGGVADTVEVTVTPAGFKPTQDTEITGDLNTDEVDIPAGVKVTVKNGARIVATGPVRVAGTLSGDCVPLELVAGGDLTVTGTVSNACSEGAAVDTASHLRIRSLTGGMAFEGARVTSSRELMLGDTGTAAAPSAPFGVAPLRSEGAGTCVFFDATVETVTRPGGDLSGGSVVIACPGDVGIVGGTFRAGNGLDGADRSGTGEVRGGNGGRGGSVTILSNTGTVRFRATGGQARVFLGSGGRGGDAQATGSQPVAVGGRGGWAGRLEVLSRSPSVIEPGALRVEMGDGGRGGEAVALANNGLPAAGATPATPGRPAEAWGGEGGGPGDLLALPLGAVGPLGALRAAVARHGSSGLGGPARGRAGDGGAGGEQAPDGAAGGNASASGGLTVPPADWLPPSLAPSGSALIEGGNGGAGAARCTGAGGAGGPGGEGFIAYQPQGFAGLREARRFGNGGRGGAGAKPGPGGAAGLNKSLVTVNLTDPPNFTSGAPGAPCAQDVTTGVSVAVKSDPAAHGAHVAMHTTSQTRTLFQPASPPPVGGVATASALGTLTISGNGNWITVSGTLLDDDTFSLSGSGSAAGFSGVGVSLVGTLKRNADGVITGFTADYTVGTGGELFGVPIVYSVNAGG